MSHRYQKLLEPFLLPNGTVLKNKMIQPKCAPDQIQGPEEWPNEQFVHFHRESARKGNSLVVVCDAFRPEVRKMPAWHDFSHSYSFNLDDPGVHNYFCQLADDVHYYGSKVIVQVRPEFDDMNISVGGGNPVRMQSAEGFMPMPPGVMATKEQIKTAIDKAVDRIAMYKEWGFDGVGIDVMGLEHETDLRDDEYGGSTEKRCRFTLEYCEAIKKRCGDKFIIEVMMEGESPNGGMGNLREGYYLEDTIVFAKLAEGLVDLITIREKSMVDCHPTGYTFKPGQHNCIGMIAKMKEAGVKIPLAVSGGFQDPDEMEKLLEEGKTDLVSIGRGQFTDDDYYEKLLEERGEDIRPCLHCNRCHGRRRAPWTSVCSVNPTFGVELKTKNMVAPVKKIKKVAIIGGGVGGMQAAITAAERGHKVVLFEKTDYLGGQLYFGDYFDFKWPFKVYRLWMIDQLEKNGVEVRKNTEPTPEEIAAEGFDAVIAATGSDASYPPIEGILDAEGKPQYRTCHDIIGKEETVPKNVVMVGCSETGVETACYLAQHGHNVTCLTRQNVLAKDASPLHSITIAFIRTEPETGLAYMAPFWEHFDNLKGITKASTTKIEGNKVTYIDENGVSHTIEGDEVVICGGVKPNTANALKYASAAAEFRLIGDADHVGDIQQAVRSGFAAASQL
jgi:2,4-dienoyl-CoA reductase-like NADH-dependent reductase (Old Yellow Enzyme family)/thioredoxin reductase